MNDIMPSSQIVAFLVSFSAVVLAGPAAIDGLRRLKMRQPIGADAPQPEAHQLKQGTPTMGGILCVVGVFVAIAVGFAAGWLSFEKPNLQLTAVVLVLVLHMALGFLDDLLKATKGKALGLKARHKLIGQLAIALAFVVFLAYTATPGLTTTIVFWPGYQMALSPWIYYPLVVILMIGLSNSVNITDGLDGLAAGLAVPAFIGLSLAGIGAQHSEVAFFGWAMAGACLAFIVYNGHPARVFMGDTGSLAIGATLAAMAVLCKEEIAVFVFCIVFLLETLSVFIQVISFKIRGKRVFKMAPIHHHFEMSGRKEVQVVQQFWILGIVAFLLGLLAASWLSPFVAVTLTQ
jgi:phospho-N-acetylmuramoyl-pentapeptide-transferase